MKVLDWNVWVGALALVLVGGCAQVVEPEAQEPPHSLVSVHTVIPGERAVICEDVFSAGNETVAVQIEDGEVSLLRAAGNRFSLGWDVEHPVLRLVNAEGLLLEGRRDSTHVFALFDTQTGERFWELDFNTTFSELSGHWRPQEILASGGVLFAGSERFGFAPDDEIHHVAVVDETGRLRFALPGIHIVGEVESDGWVAVRSIQSSGLECSGSWCADGIIPGPSRLGWLHLETGETEWALTNQSKVLRLGDEFVMVSEEGQNVIVRRGLEVEPIELQDSASAVLTRLLSSWFSLEGDAITDAQIIEQDSSRWLVSARDAEHRLQGWVFQRSERNGLEAVQIEAPAGLHLLEPCHSGRQWALVGDGGDVEHGVGGVVALFTDGRSVFLFRGTGARDGWQELGTPVTEVDTAELKVAGDHVGVFSRGSRTTFCHGLAGHDPDAPLPTERVSGTLIQLVSLSGMDASLTLEPHVASPWSTHASGRCWMYRPAVGGSGFAFVDPATGQGVHVDGADFTAFVEASESR